MAENKQNSEIGKIDSTKDNKTTAGSGAASTRQAKDENSAPTKTGTNQTESLTDNIVSQVGSALQGDTSAIKDTFGQAKESTGTVATQALGQVKDKAASVIDEQKTNIATGLTSVADGIRQVGENLRTDEQNKVAALAGKYGDNLAGQVEKFSRYIDQKEIKELARDVEQFARRNPALFIGGALALGILAARFLKSSSSQSQSSRKRSRNNRSENTSINRA